MAINVSAANGLASQLASYTTQLTQARNYLSGYKNSLNSAWQAPEMAYINKAIDQTVADINNALNQLNPLSNDIRNAADEIRREEEAAAALARKQEQIRKVRADLDAAKAVADELKRKLDQLVRIANNRPKGVAGIAYIASDKAAIATAQAAFTDAARRVDELQRTLDQLSR